MTSASQALEIMLGALAPGDRPEAGAAAAVTAGLAGGLVRAAVRGAAEWDGAGGVLAQATALVQRAGRLADDNARAHRAAYGALAGAEPAEAVGDLLERAIVFPLAIAELAADVAALAATAAGEVPGAVAPDVAGAALLAAATAETAAEIVAVNLATGPDDVRVEHARQAAAAARADADRALAAAR